MQVGEMMLPLGNYCTPYLVIKCLVYLCVGYSHREKATKSNYNQLQLPYSCNHTYLVVIINMITISWLIICSTSTIIFEINGCGKWKKWYAMIIVSNWSGPKPKYRDWS